jgi:putative transposase
MSNYIRPQQPDCKLFFTVRLQNRNSNLLVHEIERLRAATRQTRQTFPFEIDEIVVLPAVIHTIWTLPSGDTDFSKRWRLLKSHFSRGLPAAEDRNASAIKREEKGIWQRRFWEHHLRDDEDLAAHRHMILTAPVQAGLVARPEHWAHSSIHRAIRLGQFDPQQKVGAFYAPTPCRPLLKTG